MEIGMINHEDEGYDEQALYALTGEESIMETNMWEDPDCQMFNALDQSGKQTSLCWQCHKPGHQKRDCWSRPRNQMLMGNRGGSSTSYRANPPRGRGGPGEAPPRPRTGAPSTLPSKRAEVDPEHSWASREGTGELQITPTLSTTSTRRNRASTC